MKRAPRPGEGRPTKYNEDVLKKVEEYISLCVDEEDEFHKTRGTNSDSYERTIRVKLPTFEGLALHLGVSRFTVLEWMKIYPEFSASAEKINILQKERLISGGLSGLYNQSIAKLVLSANHNMREKTDITTNDEPIAANQIVVQERINKIFE